METQTMLADQLHASLLDAADRHNAAQALVWLEACRRLTAVEPEPAAARRLFSVANRQLAALTLLPKAAIKALQAQQVLAAEAWSPGDAGRALLLLRALAAGAGPALAFDLYRGGDSLEQQAVVKALILLPRPEGWLALATDASRSHVAGVFQALACDNAYPAQQFPDLNFNQLVLKALFTGAPARHIAGLERRWSPELEQMVAAYATERRAAGRSVSDDVVFLLQGLHHENV
ncbi:hypothetical protein HNO92_003230 [Chromobacterium alkanivorans]|uniref:EboA domain-containing protein n=1 Tax=Chromobacterium alkanivorans TaxID=1071719 RepID=UPI00216849B3|nr:EboA domain-containing protein [Chromobacterium alkanivorans]MCS3805629.1 hypothetical protein [Chromobacterium alkanivorans]MCS3820141.1 hypothetical protein [Chromobacterium alkanivorans]MCS3874898.1 hypothetical protein [Chromobacterium alkanivorans]